MSQFTDFCTSKKLDRLGGPGRTAKRKIKIKTIFLMTTND